MRMYFGPRSPTWVMSRQDRLEKRWNELRKLSSTDSNLANWMSRMQSEGKTPADMAELYELSLEQRCNNNDAVKRPQMEEDSFVKRKRLAWERHVKSNKDTQ